MITVDVGVEVYRHNILVSQRHLVGSGQYQYVLYRER
jgi:hypothetical protein